MIARESWRKGERAVSPEMLLEYEGMTFVAQLIDEEPFVALELSSSANRSEAMFRLGETISEFRLEFG